MYACSVIEVRNDNNWYDSVFSMIKSNVYQREGEIKISGRKLVPCVKKLVEKRLV